MAVNFNFCGKISLPKETEKFKPIDRKEFASSWMNTTVKFNCISGTNRILCMTQGGKWKDDKKNSVRTFSKSTTDANGNVTGGVHNGNCNINSLGIFTLDTLTRDVEINITLNKPYEYWLHDSASTL